jgi:3-deoxy-D-manno-octulosonate 8-phosphate phosphatase (KDO 8-P phosphatase)
MKKPLRKKLFRRSLLARARRIRLLLMDADGVLTDGRVLLASFPDGTVQEVKVFHAHDGAAIKLASEEGLRTGVITGRESPAMTRRAQEMRMEFVYQGCSEKLPALKEIVECSGVSLAEIAYVGDDLPDLPVMERVGLAIAVANSAPEVKRAAHWVTSRPGGDGALREVVELLLKAQGKWEQAIRQAKA